MKFLETLQSTIPNEISFNLQPSPFQATAWSSSNVIISTTWISNFLLLSIQRRSLLFVERHLCLPASQTIVHRQGKLILLLNSKRHASATTLWGIETNAFSIIQPPAANGRKKSVYVLWHWIYCFVLACRVRFSLLLPCRLRTRSSLFLIFPSL